MSIQRNQILPVGGKIRLWTSLVMNWGIPEKFPIFGVTAALTDGPVGIPFPLSDEPIQIAFPDNAKEDRTFLLGYSVSSPRMPFRCEFFLLTVKDGFIDLSSEGFSPY